MTFKHQRAAGRKISKLYVKDFKRNLLNAKKKVSGSTIRSVKGKVKSLFTRTIIQISGNESLSFIIEGRKKGEIGR